MVRRFMKLIPPHHPFPGDLRGSVVAIGNFDGLHRGHQMLLAAARAEADARRTKWGLVTFEPHPRTFFRPSEPIFPLTPLPLKARLAAALGADFVVALAFNGRLAAMTADDFVSQVLKKDLGITHVVMGYDFHFGHGRKGSPQTMQRLGNELGFGTMVVDQVTDDSGIAPFSSSSIRDALRHGHVREAALELGYWWMIEGEVVKGDQRGRAIGFPTVNIVLDQGAEPAQGIYAVRVRDLAEKPGVMWHGAGYFGKRPTFDSDRLFAEAFLFDFEGDVYGRRLAVSFIHFIRPDRRFDSVDDLVTQMNADCIEARRRLDAVSRADPVAEFPLGRLQAEGML
jgi:riboflavin kinase / FMN adenylyltransferase